MPKSLLVADDSLTIRKVIGMVFSTEDFQITAVDNGLDAISKTRELKPDLVLADVLMPGKSGYEVCEALKSDPATAGIPVLLLAGTFEAFDEARARAARADAHIMKPFESQALLDKVKSLCGVAVGAAVRPAFTTIGAAGAALAGAPAPQPVPGPRAPAAVPLAQPPRPQAPMPPGPVPQAMRPGVPPGPMARPLAPGVPGPAGMPGPGALPPGRGPLPLGPMPGPRPGMPGPARPPVGVAPPMGMAPRMPGPAAPVPGPRPMMGAPMAPGPVGGFAPRAPMGPAPGVPRPYGPVPPGPMGRPPGAAPMPHAPPAAVPDVQALIREALAKASQETIEKIAWEVVPQLAEVIIRKELDRLVKERGGLS